MSQVVEFLNGDASLVYYTKDGHYELTINKCGEMGTYNYNNFDDIENFLVECYYFTVDMISELKNKIIVWDK